MAHRGCTLSGLRERGRALLAHAGNITSQSGEDGILLHVLNRLRVCDHWCVEFGAWDGKHLSNTFNLVAAENYRGVLIEQDSRKFEQLTSQYQYRDRIIAINACVGFSPNDGLDVLIKPLPVPHEFDLLSIDIDGNDYHVGTRLSATDRNSSSSNIIRQWQTLFILFSQ